MSHSNSNKNSAQPYGLLTFGKKRSHARSADHDNYRNFPYYRRKYCYHPGWNYWRRRPPQKIPNKRPEKERPKSPSSFSGTEEYMLKKIQETSDLIKKRLETPESEDLFNEPTTSVVNTQDKSDESSTSECEKSFTRVKSNKRNISYDVGQIHEKIMKHITKLSYSKKMNLICANSSGYDTVIRQIHKQKRLELSKALRDMCSNQTTANSDIINAIIPDIGIKIEDLPLEMIQELSSTLDWNFEYSSLSEDYCQPLTDDDYRFQPFTTPIQHSNMTVESNKDLSPSSPLIDTVPMIVQNQNNSGRTQHDDKTLVLMEVDKSCLNDSDKSRQEQTEFEDFKIDICEIKKEEDEDVRRQEENSFSNDTDLNIGEIKKEIGIDSTNDFTSYDYKFDESSNDKQRNKNWHDLSRLDCLTDGNIGIANNMELSPHNPSGCYPPNNFKHILSNNVGSQTDILEFASVEIQTISNNSYQLNIDKKNINNLDDAIKAMHDIDNEIIRLTKLRQAVFSKVKTSRNRSTCKAKVKVKGNLTKKSKVKNATLDEEQNNALALAKRKMTYFEKAITFECISEKILIMKVIENTLLAATETGKILYINLKDGTITTTIKVSTAAITALHYWVTSRKKQKHLLVGSLDTTLHEFNFDTRKAIRTTKIKQSIQCLEMAWSFVFIGTTTGNLLRYSLTQFKIEFEENISHGRIMVLKGAQEGARRILLVGTKNTPVCIRDAMSGLHLRTLTEFVTPTVYSLILENNMIYCGTTSHDLLVFNFHDGNLVHRYEVTNSKGICCMKVVGNLLFASCHDGNVYVYNIKNHKFVGTIAGPGGGILSMEVVKNIVIVGTMSLNFESILIPESILEQIQI